MERVDANLIPFAKNNPSGYRFAFGTDTTTDDINVNYNDNIKKGWGTTPNEFPEVEDFNAMAYTSSYLTAYLYQMGISEWNDKQNYRQYSRVIGSDGNLYKSLTGTSKTPNTGNNPLSDVVNWKSLEAVSLTGNQTIAGVKTFSSNIVGNITGNSATATKLATARTINGVAFDGSANITVSDATAVKLTGDQTVADVKTFSSNIVGNITGNSGTATKLSTTRANYKGTTDSVVAGELMWKNYGNSHTIFDASNSTTPTGVAKNNTNPDIPWVATYPTLMGYNGTNTCGVRVDSARVADSATAFTTAVGSAPSYACRAWVNFNGFGTVAIRASGNVSSITDNGVGNYTVNFTVNMPDANYSLAGIASVAGNSGASSLLILVEGLAASNTYALKTTSNITVYTINNENDVVYDAFSANVSIFR